MGSPHPRGDGPPYHVHRFSLRGFSPPAWGWSAETIANGIGLDVLPTRVGMVRMSNPITTFEGRSPHPRGDGPPQALKSWLRISFSPPAWGWSARQPTISP